MRLEQSIRGLVLALLVGLCAAVGIGIVIEIRVASLVTETRTRLVATSQNTNALLIQLGLTADLTRTAVQRQKEYWDETGKKTEAIATGIQKSVTEIQTRILPHLDADLVDIGEGTNNLRANLAARLPAVDQGIAQIVFTLDAAHTQLANPEIAQTIHGLNTAAEQTAATMTNVATTTKRVDTVATKYETELMKPTGFVKNLVLHVLPPLVEMGAGTRMLLQK